MQIPLCHKTENHKFITDQWFQSSKYSLCPNHSVPRLFGVLTLPLRVYLGLERGDRPPTTVKNKPSHLVQIQVLKIQRPSVVLRESPVHSRFEPSKYPRDFWWMRAMGTYSQMLLGSTLEKAQIWFSSIWISVTCLLLSALKADQIRMLLLAIRAAFFSLIALWTSASAKD